MRIWSRKLNIIRRLIRLWGIKEVCDDRVE
jgi:hypothetical protein